MSKLSIIQCSRFVKITNSRYGFLLFYERMLVLHVCQSNATKLLVTIENDHRWSINIIDGIIALLVKRQIFKCKILWIWKVKWHITYFWNVWKYNILYIRNVRTLRLLKISDINSSYDWRIQLDHNLSC